MPVRTASPITSRRANAASSSNSIAARPARIVTGLAENVPPCGSAGLPDLGSNTAMTFPAAGDGADRKAAANDLSERGQVGIDAPDALRSAIAEAKGDDLVEDQQRADLTSDLAQRLQIGLVRRRKTRAVRHGIDQNAGEFRAMLADQADGSFRIVEGNSDHIGQDVIRRTLGDRPPKPAHCGPTLPASDRDSLQRSHRSRDRRPRIWRFSGGR